MEQYQSNNGQQYYEDDALEIDWKEVLARLLKHWKQIFIICFIFGLMGIASALSMKRMYSVKLTLAPEMQSRSTGGYGSIASMLGMSAMSMYGATDAMNITLFPEICKSTPFLAALLEVPLQSYVSEEQKEQGVQPLRTTVYKHITGEDREKTELQKIREARRNKDKPAKEPFTGVKDPTELPPDQAAVVSALAGMINCDVDKKTGITTIGVVMDDPYMVKQLADTVCSRLQVYVGNYRTQKSKADYEYYVVLADEARQELMRAQAEYAASVDYDRSVILQSANSEKDRLREEVSIASQLYSRLAQQRELARAKIQEEKPVYAVVQPAVLPRGPMNSRAKRVLIWCFFGVIISFGWYGFGDEFYKTLKSDVKEILAEEKKS